MFPAWDVPKAERSHPPSLRMEPGLRRRNRSCTLAEGRLRGKPPHVCGKHLAQGAQTTKRERPRLFFPSQPSQRYASERARDQNRREDEGLGYAPTASRTLLRPGNDCGDVPPPRASPSAVKEASTADRQGERTRAASLCVHIERDILSAFGWCKIFGSRHLGPALDRQLSPRRLTASCSNVWRAAAYAGRTRLPPSGPSHASTDALSALSPKTRSHFPISYSRRHPGSSPCTTSAKI
ncbi:hypothetical protein MRX96_013161 [Rhipicephalus microplus]